MDFIKRFEFGGGQTNEGNELYSTDGTNTSRITLSPSLITELVNDGTYHSTFTQSASSVGLSFTSSTSSGFTIASGSNTSGSFQLQLTDLNGNNILQTRGDKKIVLYDTVDLVLATTTGTKIGTATSQKLGLWNTTPIVQPTTSVTAATFVANTSLIANDTATWDGYTIGKVVKALRNIGILA